MNSTIAALILFGSQDYVLHPNSLPPTSNERSAQFAYSKAIETLNQVGLSHSGPPTVRLQEDRQSARNWSVHWSDKLEVCIDSLQGDVITIFNWARLDEWHRGRDRPDSLLLHNDSIARVETKRVLQRLGIPSDASWSQYALTDEVDGKHASIFVAVQRTYRGRNTSAGANITIDRKDGKIVDFSKHWDFVIETEEPTLSVGGARNRAREIYENALLVSDRYEMDAATPTLAYKRPGNGFGSNPYPLKDRPMRLRIAYIFKFGPDRVFVDATNGNSLGGTRWPQRPGR